MNGDKPPLHLFAYTSWAYVFKLLLNFVL